ncbi:MAG: CPBP family intramembrane metalloprotease [Verrucomicrobiota bacterium]|nr:CPBP family intramembrane metalloprotease [Verrucomicrobiota bacterium]
MKTLLLLLSLSPILHTAAVDLTIEAQPLDFSLAQPIDATLVPPLSPEELKLPPINPPHKNTAVALGLSYLFPGLGHVYLDEMKTAGGLISSTLLSAGLAISFPSQEDLFITSLISLQTAWSYGLYSVYRDVRSFNKGSYSYKMPTDSFVDLTYAPFKFSVLKKPEVWGGLLGALSLGVAVSYFLFPPDAAIPFQTSEESSIPPYVALPVGIGEETLFRGYIQSLISENVNPWTGIALSSLAFGAAHIPNANALEPQHRWRYYAFSLPLITTMGAYFGWVTHKNHSLQESVAIHTWYDLIIFTAGALASKAATPGPSTFAISFPF